MAVVNTNKAYDHPTYTARRVATGGVVAAGTLTPSAYLMAVQKLNLYRVTGYLTAAGTVGTANIDAIKVEGTTTTTMATNNIGTAAVKGTFVIDLTTSGAAPTALAAGGYAYLVNRLDATVASIAGWEYGMATDGNITAPAS
jgi:hypothetical protein